MQDDLIKSAEYCHARAEDSERMANQAKDPRNKAIFYELADRWRRLAKESYGDTLKPIGGRPAATRQYLQAGVALGSAEGNTARLK